MKTTKKKTRTKKSERQLRSENMVRAIRLTWASLESHLDHAIKSAKKYGDDDEAFHAMCACEYSELADLCCKELAYLNPAKKK